jgi:GMP synthase-like glutamine amidotransferase
VGTPVGFVITETPGEITADVRHGYDRAVAVLAAESGGAVTTSHYLDPLPAAEVLVLSGSWAPWAAHDQTALEAFGARLRVDPRPVLGICAGMQLLARAAGGRHDHMADRTGEHGFQQVELVSDHPALAALPRTLSVFEEHGDEVTDLPASLELVATNPASRVQAFVGRDRPWWGTQFHPERATAEAPDGLALLRAFFAAARG